MQLVRICLLLGCLVGATFVAPRLNGSDPWLGVYVAYASLSAVVCLCHEWSMFRRAKS